MFYYGPGYGKTIQHGSTTAFEKEFQTKSCTPPKIFEANPFCNLSHSLNFKLALVKHGHRLEWIIIMSLYGRRMFSTFFREELTIIAKDSLTKRSRDIVNELLGKHRDNRLTELNIISTPLFIIELYKKKDAISLHKFPFVFRKLFKAKIKFQQRI